MSRTVRRVLWVIGAIVVVVIVGLVVRHSSQPARAATAQRPGRGGGGPAVAVQAAKAQYGQLTTDLTLVGVVAPVTQLDVKAQIAEPIESLPVKLGQHVTKGQVLAKLDPSSLNAQLASAQAALDEAEAHLTQVQNGTPAPQLQLDKAAVKQKQAAVQQAKELYDDAQATFKLQAPVTGSMASISQLHQTVDQAQASYDAAVQAYQYAQAQLTADEAPPEASVVAQAQASAAQAQAQVAAIKVQLGETVIDAPMDGVITSLPAAVGMLAGSSVTLMTLQSAAPQINVTVPQQQVGQVKVGDVARVLPGSGGTAVPAHVTLVNPAGDASTLTFPVVLVPDQASAALLPGQSVQVELQTGQLPHALLIPASALQPINGQNDVYAIKDGVAHLQPVKIAARSDNQLAISSGLAAGDQVVVGPQEYLADGAHVTVISTPADGGSSTGS